MRRLEIRGRRFGMLTAVEELAKVDGKRCWSLRCDCGNYRIALQKAFTSGGKMRSCGCASPPFTPHGLSRTREYKHWMNMRSRCENPNTPYFKTYGGRGITVCDRWRGSFENFYSDMGPKPSPRHSLDRIDPNGNYEPANCRWATTTEQGRNTRANRAVVLDGKEMTLAEAAENAPVSYNTVLYRLKRGWAAEAAVTYPARKGFRPDAA